MKPLSTTFRKKNRFPLIDCNYRVMTLDGYRGRSVRIGRSNFRNISADYFKSEARHDFLLEAFCFVLIVITAAAPLVSATNAVVDLCRAFAQF